MAKGKAVGSQPEASSTGIGVFLSWSGDPSKGIAEALSFLISNVFQDVTPFVSSNDIEAGAHWFGRIAQELERTNFGIVCLTPTNLDKQWIHFEAGALAKQVSDRARVVPYLHGLSPSALTPPLSMFIGVKSDQQGTLKLLQSLNETRATPFEQDRLREVFEKWWPDFEKKMNNLPSVPQPTVVPLRSERDILEELLARTKTIQDLAKLQEPVLSRADVATARAQLALKIAEIETKRIETEERYSATGLPSISRTFELSSVVHDLRRALNSIT